ncbi:MAG TPA: sigma-70 family RNA polymerase sigma factor [Streptosporangiaceae bacterium]
MIGDEELDALFTTLGGQLDDAELDRRVAGFRGALRRLREDHAEAARIDALATDPDDDLSVAALVTRAAAGDPVAWDEIVDRYTPLVWSICRRFQLSGQDTEDVAQNVWLLLVEHCGRLRDPAALPGWLATTTRRECLRVVKAAQKSERSGTKPDKALQFADDTAIFEEILAAERNTSLLAAFAELPLFYQQLLAMLMADPPYSYAQISEKLNIPVGSIGPQRARGLERLRRSDAFIAPRSGADEPSPASPEAAGPDGRDDE